MQLIELIKPDDCHLHLRDGAQMNSIIGHSAMNFARAIIMPNTVPPILNCEQAYQYRDRILAALGDTMRFTPLMTIYLTDHTPIAEVKRLADSEHVHAIKYYPANASTHSELAVTDIKKVYPLIEATQKYQVPLLLHGEVTDPEVDVFDREQVFIDTILTPLVEQFPCARLVLEHISTRQAVDFIKDAPSNIAATITPQHLLMNRNALFNNGLHPHHYCLPLLKAEQHRQAIVAAATSGDKHFFLGTDSAPHPLGKKQSACGCAGIYSAHAALAFYLEAFESVQKLAHIEAFASKNGADFYALPYNQEKIRLVKKTWTIPQYYSFGEERLIPLRAGENCTWALEKK